MPVPTFLTIFPNVSIAILTVAFPCKIMYT
jgi:hypothetical protein